MKSLLIENARKLNTNPSKLQKSQKRIRNSVYYQRTLYREDEFLNLVWMVAGNILGSELYNHLTPDDQPRTLGNIVKRIKLNNSGDSTHEILEELNRKLALLQQVESSGYSIEKEVSTNIHWFEDCLAINGTFDPRIMQELWVRDLLKYEKNQSPEGLYYIEDGCHRALIYALRLYFEEAKYIPTRVLWCKSWRHILPWAQEPE
ncbi:hypothetical protein JT359_10705 [Candidatus Poribacteria bacterium]|nr:hypothetical protein [Candidatus Poribacteria bacterium]